LPAPDIDRTDLLVLIGVNPLVSNASGITTPRGRLKAIQERGGRMIVIDPVRTATAELADQRLSVRPGGDAALLAALVNVILQEGLDRLHRLGEHAAGADTLRTAVSAFTPEAVAGRCGFEPRVIRELAREIAAAPTAAIYGRCGAMLQEFGSVVVWLLYAGPSRRGALPPAGGRRSPHPRRRRKRISLPDRPLAHPGRRTPRGPGRATRRRAGR
jgi:anaerobic selenocysteine-containing dehydrogenase